MNDFEKAKARKIALYIGDKWKLTPCIKIEWWELLPRDKTYITNEKLKFSNKSKRYFQLCSFIPVAFWYHNQKEILFYDGKDYLACKYDCDKTQNRTIYYNHVPSHMEVMDMLESSHLIRL